MSESESNERIRFENVSKSYKDILALDNVSFKINKGDVFGYIGPNGAGKTTTIKIIVGLIKDYSGEIFFDGKNRSKSQIHKIIGYHPQEAGFQEWKTVNHVMQTFGLLSGLRSAELQSAIERKLDFVGLIGERNKKVKHLSGGMLQKLRLAQALLTEPEILILDEPLTGLDPSSRFQLKNLIKKLSKQGKTIIFSSHILSDVQDITNVVGIINHGKILRVGTPEELQNEFQIGHVIEIEYANSTDKYLKEGSIEVLDSIETVGHNKQIVHLKSEVNLDEATHKILGFLYQNNFNIRSFRIIKPSLEEVYLKYIGERTE